MVETNEKILIKILVILIRMITDAELFWFPFLTRNSTISFSSVTGSFHSYLVMCEHLFFSHIIFKII